MEPAVITEFRDWVFPQLFYTVVMVPPAVATTSIANPNTHIYIDIRFRQIFSSEPWSAQISQGKNTSRGSLVPPFVRCG